MCQSEEARICCGEKKSQWNAPEEADFSLERSGGAGVTHRSHSGAQADGTAAILGAAGCQGSREKKSLERFNEQLNRTHWADWAPPKSQGPKVQPDQQERRARHQGTYK